MINKKSSYIRTSITRIIQIVAVIILLLFSNQNYSQSLSDGSMVSILTCSNGDELYSTFGHSAIRIVGEYDGKNIDWVYNYGTFELTDDFYYRFTKGQLDYKLSKQSFAYFQYEYIQTNRGIIEQVLNLDLEQQNKLLRFLENNVKPENAYYRYDFYYDNCSTRIRDVLKENFGNDLVFLDLTDGKTTFRDMLQPCLADMRWSFTGISTAMGIRSDNVVLAGEDMYLPEFLMKNLSKAAINDTKFVLSEQEILPQVETDYVETLYEPTKIFWMVVVLNIVVFLFGFLAKKQINWFYNLPFFVTGLVGLFLFVMWFFTDHPITKYNLNLLWAFPLNLLVPFLWKRGWVQRYLKFYGIVLLVIILAFKWFPQQIPPSIFPLLVILLIATVVKIWYSYSNNKQME